MSSVRVLAIVLIALVAVSLPACSGADYQVSDDRRGEVNGRSFELVSTKSDGDEWSFRARGNSLWVGFVRGEKIGELGEIELSSKEARHLWDLIENVDVGGRKRGRPENRRGTITMRLREPNGDGARGHDLTTVFVPRRSDDEDVTALGDYLVDLVRLHKQVEPTL